MLIDSLYHLRQFLIDVIAVAIAILVVVFAIVFGLGLAIKALKLIGAGTW